jgi:hypothetical protein
MPLHETGFGLDSPGLRSAQPKKRPSIALPCCETAYGGGDFSVRLL